MGWRTFIIAAAVGLAAAGVAFGAATPGPHRLMCPTCFGLTAIGPGIYGDAAPTDHAAMVRRVERARAATAAFFGVLRSQPTIVLCAQPRGITTGALTHELIHAELHWRLGLLGYLQGRAPNWFHEGLASHLAGYPYRNGSRLLRRRPWIWDIRSQRDWQRGLRLFGATRMYSAAQAEVAHIERLIGRDGLARMVRRMTDGADLAAAMAAEGVSAPGETRARRHDGQNGDGDRDSGGRQWANRSTPSQGLGRAVIIAG